MVERDKELGERIANLEGRLKDKDERIKELATRIDDERSVALTGDNRLADEFRSEDNKVESRLSRLEQRLVESVGAVEKRLADKIDKVEDDFHKETDRIGKNVNIAIIVGATLLASMITALITMLS